MKSGAWRLGAAIVLAAACNKAPAPMTDADRKALADSIDQMATQMFASLAKDAAVEKVLSYFVEGNELISGSDGMLFPTRDSLAKVAARVYRPGTRVDLKLDQKHLTVLDRDAVVMAAILNGAFKDSAGNEAPVHEAWLAVYHRTAEGWKIVADLSSTPPPAPAPAKPASRR